MTTTLEKDPNLHHNAKLTFPEVNFLRIVFSGSNKPALVNLIQWHWPMNMQQRKFDATLLIDPYVNQQAKKG